MRDKLCHEGNLSVLTRIGYLEAIPGTVYATKEHVAKFYGVSLGTLDSAIARHKDELLDDGYNILSKKEFENLHDASLDNSLSNRGIAVFTRRSVLRIGMVLRDSEVAKKVRSYLLDIEEHIAPNVRQGELAQIADQIVAQALLVKAVVNEINMARDGINDLNRKYQEHDHRISILESGQYRQQQLEVDYITQNQIEQLRNRVKKLSDKPITVWRRFNKAFDITRYKFLPRTRFNEALNWLDNYERTGE